MRFTNINSAFGSLVHGIHRGSIATTVESSRNGDVLRIDDPFCITYENPTQRVLFNKARDCNPFFHLYESLWMLAGRNDLASLCYYLPGYKQFSDDGQTVNGAYGHRWRHASRETSGVERAMPDFEDIDQLKIIIEHLRANPTSRRAVLQMWNVEDDLLKVDTSKDVACNLCVVFSIRKEELYPMTEADKQLGDSMFGGEYKNDLVYSKDRGPRYKSSLDMTVFNRSNDLILGALGANVVHFSFLQEYIANCLGVEVGVYHQVSSNMHVYTANWRPEEWLKEEQFDYPTGSHINLVENQERFDKECKEFCFVYDGTGVPENTVFYEPFLQHVAIPMMEAFRAHKKRRYHIAEYYLERIEAADWQRTAAQWIHKRMDAYLAKQKGKI